MSASAFGSFTINVEGGTMKQPAIYILSNSSNSVLYIGVTGNLAQRVWLHKTEDGRRRGLHSEVQCTQISLF